MKVAFYNIFEELKNAEQETLLRLDYCFKKQGHTLLITNKYGMIVSEGIDNGKHIEDVDIDFLFTYNTLELALMTFPDVFSIFFHWAPIGFLANFQSLLLMKYFNLFDYFACTYEQDIFSRVARIPTTDIPFIGSSIPKDFAIKARKHNDRKLFYVGLNFERCCEGKMRYEKLFTQLDSSNKIEIYGPEKVYGVSNLWAGFKNYKGEIPFDGYSILKKINQAGICLAINSPMHNDANGVSNRTYEAAAAGALIISDDNSFVRKYFKDSVFYLDKNLNEVDSSKKILEILDWANQYPEEAYEMAKRSNEIFINELSLDDMVSNLISHTQKAITKLHNKDEQKDVIDVICFIENNDFEKLKIQLERQYYQNLHLIIISDEKTFEKIKSEINYPYHFIKSDSEFKGRDFIKAIKYLKSEYFMFLDVHSKMHKRHIHKNLEVLKNRDELFSYSGCYIKGDNQYITLNNKPILRDEFLSFSLASGYNRYDFDSQVFYIETIFSRNCALFKKAILEHVLNEELEYLSNNIHFYLACCSIIKAKKLGRFTYAITSGYKGNSLKDVEEKAFSTSRKFWHTSNRSAKTYIKEMNEIFFKYNFEVSPNFIPNRNLNGEILWFKELATSNALCIDSQEQQVLDYIFSNKIAYGILNILAMHKRKKYPKINERFVSYFRNHHLIRNIYRHIAKRGKKHE